MHIKHSEAFAMIFIEVFVMHFMRPANSPDIGIGAAREPFEALMDDHIMNNEIGEAVGHDAVTDRLHPPYMIYGAEHDQQHTGYGKDDEEGIIFLEKSGFNLMVVAMEIPQESMHYPFMGRPGDGFHQQKGGDQYQYEIQTCHNPVKLMPLVKN
jgi:hypothetical protein